MPRIKDGMYVTNGFDWKKKKTIFIIREVFKLISLNFFFDVNFINEQIRN